MRFQFELTGRTPLLVHGDDVEWSDTLEGWRKDPKNKNLSRPGDDRSPGWTWIGYAYHDGEHFTLPSDNLSVCLRQAGARVQMKGMKTFKETAVSGLWIEQENLTLTVGGKPIPIAPFLALKDEHDYRVHMAAAKKAGFELWAKRARVGTSKHVRVRPRFNEWSLTGSLEVLAQELSADVVQVLFEQAGLIGVGSWRPGGKTPGRFGMFVPKLKQAK